MSLSAEYNSIDQRRRASVARTENTDQASGTRAERSRPEPVMLKPASQLPRRHSSVTPLLTTTPPIQQFQGAQSHQTHRTPPAVPVRGRKASTDREDSTATSTAMTTTTTTTTTQANTLGTIHHSMAAPSTTPTQTLTNPFLYNANNPFIEHIAPKAAATSVVPPAIPPPPARSRRSSAVPYDGSNAPSRRASSVYLDTAPASRRSSTVSTDHSDPVPEAKITQPTIILPHHYQELQRQSVINKRNPCMNGVTCHTDGDGPAEEKALDGSRGSVRQDSNVSSESVSQTSSPSYTTKTMETPLLLNHIRKMEKKASQFEVTNADKDSSSNNALTKSISTPASLQTCVRFNTGSNMTLQHRIIRDIRRPSTNYPRRRIRFRYIQVIVNAIVLIFITAGFLAYLQSHPEVVRVVNNTVTNTIALVSPEANPSPGFCLKLIVKLCVNRVPYNFTTFPNHVVNMNQMQAEQVGIYYPDSGLCVRVIVEFCIDHQAPYNYSRFPSRLHVSQTYAAQELEIYDALVDVRCYELSALFLCSVFVPKCGPSGNLLYPCKSLCEETKHRCGFFLEVFGLKSLPEYLMQCNLLPESDDPDECVGYREVREAKLKAQKPNCSKDGFLCDAKRCIPLDLKCDGHLDCEDKTDEQDCHDCPTGMVHCGEKSCIDSSHMCDGVIDCPYGQDERNCIRLQERMGDVGSGQLQVFKPETEEWMAACVSMWDDKNTPSAVCSLLGYSDVNSTRVTILDSNVPLQSPQTPNWTDIYGNINWVKEFRSCSESHYPVVRMECHNYVCGKRRTQQVASKRIVGGQRSQPGDWPFLAALLGGPEEIFYCAGVLIADQWVLTASHCAGNFTEASIDGWKIQLGITRRHSHSYYGTKVKVKRVIPHPLYNVGVNHDNDIALFQLKERVNFNEHLLPVCLPPPGRELLPGTNCTVIGWGKSEDLESSEYEPAVNEVQVPVINRELCNKWMIYKDLNVTEGMICAGLAEGGKDACQGDSGGPLLCPLDKDRWFVGGIVSWGIKCANPHLPGVYAYVPKYVPWIKEQMDKFSD